MKGIPQLIRSLLGLIRIQIKQLGLAALYLLQGRRRQAEEHVRIALQALHDDLAALAARGYESRNLPSAAEVSRILIVKLDRVGDMVNTMPVFDFLRSRYPDAELDLVGHPAVLTMVEGDLRIGARFQYKSVLYHDGSMRPPKFSAWRLIWNLSKRHYSLVVYLRGTFPFLFLALRSHFCAAKFVPGEPVVRRYLKPLRAFSTPDDPLPMPSLHVDAASRKTVLAKFPHFASGSNIVIHPVSGAEGKQWPLERFARAADEIARRTRAQILFLAAPSEEVKISQLKNLCREFHYFETGFKLSEVVAAISLADVFIGNDSGPAHIAAAVGTREVIIWGGANLEMAKPVAPPSHCSILYHAVACRAVCPEVRCVSEQPLQCLRKVHESDVVTAVLDHLSASCGSSGQV